MESSKRCSIAWNPKNCILRVPLIDFFDVCLRIPARPQRVPFTQHCIGSITLLLADEIFGKVVVMLVQQCFELFVRRKPGGCPSLAVDGLAECLFGIRMSSVAVQQQSEVVVRTTLLAE